MRGPVEERHAAPAGPAPAARILKTRAGPKPALRGEGEEMTHRHRAEERFEERMCSAGLSPDAREAFQGMYRAYRSGHAGKIPWDQVRSPEPGDLVELAGLEEEAMIRTGEAALDGLVWIVLNGGLGTSMEMDRAKSLLRVKGDATFLDLTARHVLRLRQRWRCGLPLLLMNSFATREDSLRALAPHSLGGSGEKGESLPLDFVQDRFPRVRAGDALPFGEPEAPEAWAPPGHGNLYLALKGSGLLARLLDRGYRWAFVSNADNLGASPHRGILGHMVSRRLGFLMEVTAKTAADVKGGILIRRQGRLELLEIAQVPEDRVADFQDTDRFPAFNTNNLWVDLVALAELLNEGPLDLPLIVNRKQVGPTAVVQLETAMGAAIGRFVRAGGVLVPRRRFAPVKTTDDLLVRRSDAYAPGEEAPLVPSPARPSGLGPPVVSLDPRYYRSVPDLELRIPHPPSLLRARRLQVRGDVRFGEGVVIEGEAVVANPGPEPMWIGPGTVLSGSVGDRGDGGA